MFTTEIRINGILILHIYGHNTSVLKDGKHQYFVEVFQTEKSAVKKFEIYHDRKDGISKLIELILSKYNSL